MTAKVWDLEVSTLLEGVSQLADINSLEDVFNLIGESYAHQHYLHLNGGQVDVKLKENNLTNWICSDIKNL